MSAIVLIVFAPVIIAGVALVALLLGAATAGAWESIEEHSRVDPPVDGPLRSQVATQEGPHTRAA